MLELLPPGPEGPAGTQGHFAALFPSIRFTRQPESRCQKTRVTPGGREGEMWEGLRTSLGRQGKGLSPHKTGRGKDRLPSTAFGLIWQLS